MKTATCYPFRGRRNLLTFSEETLLYAAIIFYFLLESGAFVSIYQLQDSIGPDAVFYTMHILFTVFDLFFMVYENRICLRITISRMFDQDSSPGMCPLGDSLQELHISSRSLVPISPKVSHPLMCSTAHFLGTN